MSENNNYTGEEYPMNNPKGPFNGEKVDFPVTYDLKVFMDATVPDKVNKNNLARVLYELEVPFSHWSNRLSSEGKYISFSVSITVNNKSTFVDLYKQLKALPGVKYAI